MDMKYIYSLAIMQLLSKKEMLNDIKLEELKKSSEITKIDLRLSVVNSEINELTVAMNNLD